MRPNAKKKRILPRIHELLKQQQQQKSYHSISIIVATDYRYFVEHFSLRHPSHRPGMARYLAEFEDGNFHGPIDPSFS